MVAPEPPATDATSDVDDGDPDTLVPGRAAFDVEMAPLEGFIDEGDRYEARQLLARGGMGEVLLAWDTRLGREVAIKTLRRDLASDAWVERFAVEGRVAAQLEHPNIVPVYDEGIAKDGRPYYVMRRIRGRSLAQILGEGLLPSAVERIDVFRKVCDAIAFAHERGVLHRDLKPGNVMVGEFGEVIVLDWGIARPAGVDAPVADPLSSGSETMGTPLFMPPELLRGQRNAIDERADVYALGVLLYQLLTDALPFVGPDALEQAKTGRFAPSRTLRPDRVDEQVDAIVGRAMATDPEQRYRSAQALRLDLRAYLEGRAREAPPADEGGSAPAS
jgi:serine/threonine-protein kinase